MPPVVDFEHPHFWRHFLSYVGGAVLVAGGLVGPALFPPLAVAAPYLVASGAGLLGIAGTKVLGQVPAVAPALPGAAPPAPPAAPGRPAA